MMVSKQAVLFLTHVIDEQVMQRFYKLYESSHFNYDVYLGLHNETNEEPVISYGQLYSFRLIDFATLNYSPHGKTLYHNTNYVMQKFRKDYPIYDYYWFVEYDVVFTGEWAFLFDYYANKRYDFISSHIEFHNETNNQWCWWNRTTWGETILPKHRLLKSFNPICRYSSAALDFLDKFLQQGVNGHFETIILSYNTSGMAVGALNNQFWGAAAQIGVNNILGSVLPSKTFQATDHFSLSISPLIGIGPMGFSLGASYSFGFHYDDWSLGFGIGGGNGYIGFNTSIYNSKANFGLSYGRTSYEESMFNGNVIDAQTVGSISMFGKGWSFSFSNDYLGDGEDRGRTSAAELCIGNFVIGTNILGNNGKETSDNTADGKPISKFFKHLFKRSDKFKYLEDGTEAGSWLFGQVFHSPFWIGYKSGNMTYRLGYSSEIIQKYTQNFVHMFMTTPFFSNYDSFHRGLYFSMGNYNPYNFW